MRKSIVRKVFISIVSILTVTLCLQVFFQMTIMPKLYVVMKSRETEKQFLTFVEDYRNDVWTKEELNALTEEYRTSTASPILVLDQNLVIQNDRFFERMNYIVVESGNKRIKVLIGNRVDEEGRLFPEFAELTMFSHVEVKGGMLHGDQVMLLDYDLDSPLIQDEIHLSGTIVQTHYIRRDQGVYSYQSDKLLREAGTFFAENAGKDEEGTFRETETGLDIRIRAQEQPDQSWVIGLFTIEDISETFLVLNNYYIYIFGLQLLLFAMLAMVYSRWITKPLRVLSKEADRISHLDFSQESQVRTGDELEDLSHSLNRISKNMEKNIALLKEDAQKKEANEQRMRELLANLSHEFKTPLGIMSGFLEMLEVTDDNKTYYIQTIAEEIDKLNGLTKETLLLCESEGGSTQLNMEVQSFGEFVNLEKFERQIEEKNLRVIHRIQDALVICDARKIQIVIDNLMSNAIKYSPAGESIIIESLIADHELSVSIKNTGSNLSDEEMTRVWEKYYRTEKSRNKRYGGNGIGLTIVRNILEKHRSEFGVVSENNAVVFFFTLPIVQDEELK
ncbi:hypothetical protein SANA_08100 [Gottschalkiaceae bacterium SANA]|nr:hypothetical protein SANA_08100 [Gottschalkiaceae bacterium SANA]